MAICDEKPRIFAHRFEGRSNRSMNRQLVFCELIRFWWLHFLISMGSYKMNKTILMVAWFLNWRKYDSISKLSEDNCWFTVNFFEWWGEWNPKRKQLGQLLLPYLLAAHHFWWIHCEKAGSGYHLIMASCVIDGDFSSLVRNRVTKCRPLYRSRPHRNSFVLQAHKHIQNLRKLYPHRGRLIRTKPKACESGTAKCQLFASFLQSFTALRVLKARSGT